MQYERPVKPLSTIQVDLLGPWDENEASPTFYNTILRSRISSPRNKSRSIKQTPPQSSLRKNHLRAKQNK